MVGVVGVNMVHAVVTALNNAKGFANTQVCRHVKEQMNLVFKLKHWSAKRINPNAMVS